MALSRLFDVDFSFMFDDNLEEQAQTGQSPFSFSTPPSVRRTGLSRLDKQIRRNVQGVTNLLLGEGTGRDVRNVLADIEKPDKKEPVKPPYETTQGGLQTSNPTQTPEPVQEVTQPARQPIQRISYQPGQTSFSNVDVVNKPAPAPAPALTTTSPEKRIRMKPGQTSFSDEDVYEEY